MPRFEPFAALRFSQRGDITHLVCPPYDVIDDDQRAELCSADPHNAVRIELPRSSAPGTDPYEEAAGLVESWQADEVITTEPAAHFYAYRMTPPEGPATFGYLGALGATDGDGLLPHEFTTPKAKSDRLDLLRATRLNLSPIWGLSLASELGSVWRPSGDPEAFARDPEGVLHEIWTVPAAFEAPLSAAVESAAVAVADGHHRWETARAYAAEHPGERPAEFLMAFVVELSPDELQVRPIHRLVSGLKDPVAALSPWFDIQAVNQAGGPEPAGGPVLVTGAGDFTLTARAETASKAPHDADAERLQVALDSLDLDSLDLDSLDLDSLDLDSQEMATVTYMHDPRAVRRAVDEQPGSAGVLLRPVSMQEIALVARVGEKFPPKTTFFWPKPLTGFVIRALDSAALGDQDA